jgi:hypothetical protein
LQPNGGLDRAFFKLKNPILLALRANSATGGECEVKKPGASRNTPARQLRFTESNLPPVWCSEQDFKTSYLGAGIPRVRLVTSPPGLIATRDREYPPDRGRQTQQTTAHQLFRFGIPVSKFAGGLVVNHLIEVGKRDHQQRSLANVAAAVSK